MTEAGNIIVTPAAAVPECAPQLYIFEKIKSIGGMTESCKLQAASRRLTAKTRERIPFY
jgi:hypothetical protein